MGRTKSLLLTTFLMLTAGKLVAHSAPDLLASYHFVGTEALSTNRDAAQLNKIWALPESKSFRDLILQKIARASEELPGKSLKDGPALMRPLLDDLIASESFAELRHREQGVGEFVFAIRLDAQRSGLWRTNFSKLAANWFGVKASSSRSKKSEWELKRKDSPNLLRFSRVADWIVIGVGQNELPLHENLVQAVRKNSKPKISDTNWLEAQIDWPAVQKWFPMTKNSPFKPAHTRIEVSPRSGDLRTSIYAVYPEQLNWRNEPWRMPTNIIRDPLVSFTSAQNLGAILNTPDQFKRLGFNPLTNQFYMWSQSEVPFFSFAAIPVENATNALLDIGSKAPAVFNESLAARNGGRFVATNGSLAWEGLSLIRPQLHAIKEPSGEYLFAAIFPKQASTNPPPPELLAQILPRTNLIYYDWEFGQARLSHWQLMSKVLPLFPTNAPIRLEGTNAVARTNLISRFAHERWLSAIIPQLGNVTTEITAEKDNEVRFVRKSAIGFTAWELVWITRWMNDPDFPLFKRKNSPANKSSSKK